MRAKQFVPLVEAQQELFEVNMSPGNLKKLASQIDALVGIEFEMMVPNVGSVDDDDGESDPDYSMDERARDIDDIIQFFDNSDYNSSRDIEQLRDELYEKFTEWQSEYIDEQWNEDGRQFFSKWCHENVSEEDVADFAETEEDLLGDRIPSRSDWERYIEEQWDEGFGGDNYDKAYDEFREDLQDSGNFDEEDFLRSIGITDMSDVESRLDTYVTWPHWNYPDGDSEANLEELASEFEDAIGRKVYFSSGYHGGPRTNDAYTIEPDSSLSGDGDDAGLEFISPPLPIDEALDDVKKIKEWADERGAYTNRTTGLHMNVSVPGFDQEKLDFVKLALLLGDKYLLDRFGRSANSYCKSALDVVQEAPSVQDKELLFKKLKSNLETIASKVIHSGRVGKFTSINPKDNRVEFRGPGGDYLDQNFDKIEETLYRCVVALDAAVDPEKYRKEYLKKLTKMFAPTKGSIEDIFVQYQAGSIDSTELKNKLKQVQSQRKQDKYQAEGIVEISISELNDNDWIVEYDNPTGENRRMFLKRTEQISDDGKAMEAAMKLEPSWFKPDDIENIIVTQNSGKTLYAVYDNDNDGEIVDVYRALTPLQAIDIALSYHDDLDKNSLTADPWDKSELEVPQAQTLRMRPDESEFVVINNTLGQQVSLGAIDSATALSRALRNNPSWDSYQHQIRVLSASPTQTPEQEYKLYRVRGDGSQYVAARTPGEALRMSMIIYPQLGNLATGLDADEVDDADPAVVERFRVSQQEVLDTMNQQSQPTTREFYVSNNRLGGTIRVEAPSEEEAYHAATRARPEWSIRDLSVTEVGRASNQPSNNASTSGQPGEGMIYRVSDVGDTGGVTIRATSAAQAIERARQAHRIDPSRELEATLI